MAEHNYEFAGVRIRLRVGEPVYSNKKILLSDKGGYEIVKRWEEGKKITEARYSYIKDGKEVVYIRGVYDSTKSFHISQIQNILNDKTSGKYIPAVFSAMESELKESGVTDISTMALARLAPILIRRYGFHSIEGKTYKQVHDEPSNKIPGKAFPLVKNL